MFHQSVTPTYQPTAPYLSHNNQEIKVEITWFCDKHIPEAFNIERESFEFPWTKEDFFYCRRQRNCTGMIALYNHCIVGYMIYELHKSKLHFLNFAVNPEFRRRGVGKQMVEKLVNKLSDQRRNEIVIEVRESNLGAQLFFKKMGFKAVLVLRNHYDNTDEDAYVMRFTLEEAGEYEPP